MADMSEDAFDAELRSVLGKAVVPIPVMCALDMIKDGPRRDRLAEFAFSVIGQLDERGGDRMQRLTGVVVKYNPEAYVKHLQSELGRQTIEISGLNLAIGEKEAKLYEPTDYVMHVSGDSKVDVKEMAELADHAVMNSGDKISTLRTVIKLNHNVIKRLDTRNKQLRDNLDYAEALREMEKREKLRMANEQQLHKASDQQNVGGSSAGSTEDESGPADGRSASPDIPRPPFKRQYAGSQHVGI